jgi:hypothetical protein
VEVEVEEITAEIAGKSWHQASGIAFVVHNSMPGIRGYSLEITDTHDNPGLILHRHMM